VYQIVFFCGFRRAPNRVFLWFSSCTKWCLNSFFFLMILFYIPNRALVRTFLLFSSCTNWYTKKTAKKHDLVHEENQKKARFGARRKVKKSTVWCTKKTAKKHDLVHEENQKKTRFGARKKREKNTIWCPTSYHCYRG